MDEVRVSNSARSAAWIQTEYNNQSSPQTFYAVGGLQTQNRAKAGVAISGRGASGVGWYSTGGTWTNRRTITIDHTKVSSIATTTYSNFPMLFSTTDPQFKTVSNGGEVASSSGADILFTASDGLTKLNYERESYSSTTGQLIAWVQIPTLSATSDTTIYMYYGNSSASDQQNQSATWNSNYLGVWHFPNGTTLSVSDSTGLNTATNDGATATTTGQIYGGAGFNGSNEYINLGSSLSSTGSETMEFWTNTSNCSSGALQAYVVSSTSDGFAVGCNSSVWVASAAGTNAGSVQSTVAPSSANTFVVATKTTGAATNIYINGTNVTTASTGSNYWAVATVQRILGGSWTSGAQSSPMAGMLDEFRLSNTALSAGWIQTEYNNQLYPRYFYALSGSTLQTRSADIPLIKIRGGVRFH